MPYIAAIFVSDLKISIVILPIQINCMYGVQKGNIFADTTVLTLRLIGYLYNDDFTLILIKLTMNDFLFFT